MTKDWVHGVDYSPVCKILLQIVVRADITCSPPDWASSAGMLSTPADLPFFNECTAASIIIGLCTPRRSFGRRFEREKKVISGDVSVQHVQCGKQRVDSPTRVYRTVS